MDLREFLSGLELHGMKLGLENIRRLLEFAGNPQNRYTTVHVAGTNGKGSVLAMLDAMLRAAGYNTARFSKPHLLRVNERFLFNAVPIEDDALDKQIAFFQPLAEELNPTYFEMVVAVAFRWFAEKQPDTALIEVGMGGRFDSTNVITPIATAITTIDYDHMQYLGNTLEQIAFEKAGIIKPSVPLVVGENKSGPLHVILSRARELGSPVKLLGRDFTYAAQKRAMRAEFTYQSADLNLGPVFLGLPGAYQCENAAVAVALAEALRSSFPKLDAQTVGWGLESARWPCRLEQVLESPPVIIDVAHNIAGARRLAAELPPSVVILAVSADKDVEKMIDALAPITQRLLLSQFEGRRAMPLQALCKIAGDRPYQAFPTLAEAICCGMELASPELPLVITGSVFTAGEARRILVESYGAAPLQF